MAKTRGKLEAAKIYDEAKTITIDCMFNPFEYKITKTNEYTEEPKNRCDVPHVEFRKSGTQTLTLDLYFDTYETGEDVSKTTRKLMRLMESKTSQQGNQTEKIPPPAVVFDWGVFQFEAVIKQMTQTFTLFKVDGTPVRAKVNVIFTQHVDPEDYGPQNPTSGGGNVERVWRVKAGDRLDAIAYEVYGEATRWRFIAERNKIRDPLALRPGQTLVIPTPGE